MFLNKHFVYLKNTSQKGKGVLRRVAESFLGWVRFSKFRAGLLQYYMLNLISDLFEVPRYEYTCK